ncbi:MAG TPA: OmpH family outer membrane protein [Candidatus Kapabacteria bacterium]|nr:OmpH family outer membrane protein [Candidatus Kapabacteria bacterium]
MSLHTRTLIRLTTLLLAVSAGVVSAQAQIKFGVVNSDKIVSQLPELKDIEAKLQQLQSAYTDTLKAMETNYRTRLESYQKQQTMLTPDAKAKEEDALRGMEQQYAQYRDDRLGQQGALARYQAQLMQPVRDKVRSAIEKVAKDEKLSAVLEEGAFLYVDSKLDITFKVLDYLKRGN